MELLPRFNFCHPVMYIFHVVMLHVIVDFTHARISIKLEVGFSAARLQSSKVKTGGRVSHLSKERKKINESQHIWVGKTLKSNNYLVHTNSATICCFR